MHPTDLATNLLSPPILLFLLGFAAALLRSDLEIPPAAAKTLSLFLLFAIGFKGGVSLAQSGLGPEVIATLGAAAFASVAVPLWTFSPCAVVWARRTPPASPRPTVRSAR